MATATLTPPVAPTGLMSADDFLARYGDQTGHELVKGHLKEIPMPGAVHGEVCGNAYHFIREVVKANRLGRIFTNDTFIRTRTNPDGVRGADVAFVSFDSLPADKPTPSGALIPPLELVVEVRSPSDTIGQMTATAAEYLDAGVKVVVILDPQTDSAGVFRPDELPQRFHNGDELKLDDILPRLRRARRPLLRVTGIPPLPHIALSPPPAGSGLAFGRIPPLRPHRGRLSAIVRP